MPSENLGPQDPKVPSLLQRPKTVPDDKSKAKVKPPEEDPELYPEPDYTAANISAYEEHGIDGIV